MNFGTARVLHHEYSESC